MTRVETIDALLHDAERADSGASFAHLLGPEHADAAREMTAKRDRLIEEALALDPERTVPAWQETTLTIEVAR